MSLTGLMGFSCYDWAGWVACPFVHRSIVYCDVRLPEFIEEQGSPSSGDAAPAICDDFVIGSKRTALFESLAQQIVFVQCFSLGVCMGGEKYVLAAWDVAATEIFRRQTIDQDGVFVFDG